MRRKLRYITPVLVALATAASIAVAPPAAADFPNPPIGYPDRMARIGDCLSGGAVGTGIDREVFNPARDVPTDVLSPDHPRACPYVPLDAAPQ